MLVGLAEELGSAAVDGPVEGVGSCEKTGSALRSRKMRVHKYFRRK